ncbi:hypothetical protein D4764_09G0010500 [Takifugu flavidus]|uniref:Reverse transcriptase domain-containing protein n=1 Tax=Takifugu flavidus TaxID=433684 RepID=A0A5C6MRC5_9TELE|nr:hypothetical protein D4764_09G0010500 [Takifugu flavidus]
MAFIDLTKAFDLVSRSGLFQLLERIGCTPQLLRILQSFHTDMHGTIQFDGSTSDPFKICCGVKQGCVLAPTLFGIFFSLLLRQAFGTATEGVYLHTRTDGNLFTLARLKAKTKVRPLVIRHMLFADDAAVVAHSQDHLQTLMDHFSQACQDFSLVISLNKTKTMGQGTINPPSITINNYTLEAVNTFTYLGSTITDNLSLDVELSRRIGKAASTFRKLTERVWDNGKITTHTKVQVRILGVTWKDMVTHTAILERAQLPSMYSLLRQRRLRWLGHVCRMDDGHIPKDILFAELSSGKRQKGRPQLRYKDVCKQDLKSFNISLDIWEVTAQDRLKWQKALRTGLLNNENTLAKHHETKRIKRKQQQERVAIFRTYCRDKITAPSHITNIDEISLTFNIPLTHKVEKKGPARWRYAQRGTRSRRSPWFSAATETDRALDDGWRTLLHKDYEAAAGKLCHHMRVDCRRMGYDTVFMYCKSFHKINAEPEPVGESDSDD